MVGIIPRLSPFAFWIVSDSHSETRAPFRLMLLMTLGMPLKSWHASGAFARERRYYGLFADAGSEVSMLTYGFEDDQFKQAWSPIRILSRRGKIQHYYYYGLLAAFYHWRAFRQAEIVKSNQSLGSLVGLVGKLIRPSLKLIVRCGWVRTREIMQDDQKKHGLSLKIALFSEWLAFRTANAIITVTESDAQYIVDHYHIRREKIHVVPNAVDEAVLSCRQDPVDYSGHIRILMVGRLAEPKNFHMVIEAASRLDKDIEIDIAGTGAYKTELEACARKFGVPVNFLGSVDNDELAVHYRNHDLVVMTEAWGSGMPKVVLEAMSSGVPLLASTIRSVLQVVRDGENGFLCEPTVEGNVQGMQRIFTCPAEVIEGIRHQARRDVENHYSMQSCVNQEIALYRRLLKR